MLRGTQIKTGDDAQQYRALMVLFRNELIKQNYQEVVVPAVWEAKTFQQKIQGETLGQMWTFKDKGDRDVTLIPEVTAIIQEQYNNGWAKSMPKPIKIFYESKVYRYERPQLGRYREFTQFGVEVLGDIDDKLELEVKNTLMNLLNSVKLMYKFTDSVKRGLGYYIADGFEVECSQLGAQKQVAGGGRYKEGIGWAIGIERLQLALEMNENVL